MKGSRTERKKERKEGRKEGRKERRKEGRKESRKTTTAYKIAKNEARQQKNVLSDTDLSPHSWTISFLLGCKLNHSADLFQ